MMTNLMTISVKKASISSKPTTVYLSCPPLCGLFSIQQNANGGLSYKVKKNPACRILRLRRVALATFFHSAAVRSFFSKKWTEFYQPTVLQEQKRSVLLPKQWDQATKAADSPTHRRNKTSDYILSSTARKSSPAYNSAGPAPDGIKMPPQNTVLRPDRQYSHSRSA